METQLHNHSQLQREAKLGVVYVAYGEKHVRLAIRSATSLIKQNSDVPIAIFTDNANYSAFREYPDIFSEIIAIKEGHRRSKVDCLQRSPFEFTIYLDNDTQIVRKIDALFPLFERFDIAMCHAHARNRRLVREFWKTELPDSFPQLNTGLILYRKNAKTQELFDRWGSAFRSAGFKKDQVTLRELIWHSDLSLYVLPPEFNVRYEKYRLLWGRKEAQIYVLHLRRLSFLSWSEFLAWRIGSIYSRIRKIFWIG